MDAWTITDHGNANGHAHARKHFEKLAKAGRKYRQLLGVEFYFVPSILESRKGQEAAKETARIAREEKKRMKELELDVEDDSEDAGHVVEDEDETRRVDPFADEWKRRYHLVVVAKDKTGLSNLYRLVKKSFKYGFYRFPRIDFDMLKEHGEGLIVSTACLGGPYSNRVLKGLALQQSDAEIKNALQNLTDRFVDAVGRDNFFLELQFNKLEAQHSVNKYLLAHAEDTGIPLVSTADSHYCRPDLWEAREIYRRLGWKGKELTEPPKREDLKCELYPKNATQMWEEYLNYRDHYDFYAGKDELVRDSIERTHDLCWDMCQDVWIDTKVKLPNLSRPDRTAYQQLEDLAWAGLRNEGLDAKQDYVDRLKRELSDIEFMGFENYFLVMHRIFSRSASKTLFGPGRGSGAGSLVNYCLGVTQVDPLKYGLLWERFLGRHRCLLPTTLVTTRSGRKTLDDVQVGEEILDGSGTYRLITDKVEEFHDAVAEIRAGDQTFTSAPHHRWLVRGADGQIVQRMACELKVGDVIASCDTQGIRGFFNDFRWLSNYWITPVSFEGLIYPNVEAAYQAAKTLDPALRLQFSALEGEIMSVGKAARLLGRRIQLRADWEAIKNDVMLKLTRDKFTRNPALGELLVLTGDAYLEETNNWGDVYWGVCKDKGQNHLGRTLMQVRDELRSGERLSSQGVPVSSAVTYVRPGTRMIDLTLVSNHTFWVSTGPDQSSILTHNSSWPDVDSDAGDRDVMIQEARLEFGDDAVVPVSNFNTLKLKSLVQDVARLYGVEHTEVLDVTRNLQEEVMPLVKDEDTEKSVFVLLHSDCMEHVKRYRDFMEKYPRVREHIESLFMQNRSIGRHAGGVIVAPADVLESTIPLISVRGDLQTPWTEGMNFRNLEDNGFIKFDFLGLTLLEDVKNCIRRILVNQGKRNPTFLEIKKYFDEHLNCRFNEPNDPKVFEAAYHSDMWAPGLFQFTADGARRFCEEAKPRSIDDLATITAIYRPGPLKAKVDKLYVDVRRAAEAGTPPVYPHPDIEKILGPTFGFTVFQEQFMLLAQAAGFTPAESDKLRKTLVKKSLDTLGKKADERAEAREKFIEGGHQKWGVDKENLKALWKTIENMSVYCFNKSHSISYALDSYYAAWLYTYHPKEWLATILQSENGSPKGMVKTISEIKKLGYKFSKVDVNHSGTEWTFSTALDAFAPPLSSVKKVGDTAAEELMRTRPFKNLDSLFFDEQGRWYHSKANKSTLEVLCGVEAFGDLEELKTGTLKNHRQIHDLIVENYDVLRKGRYGMSEAGIKRYVKNNGVMPPRVLDELISKYSVLPDWTRSEKVCLSQDLQNDVDNDTLFPPGFLDKMEKKSVPSACMIPNKKKLVSWFVALEIQTKKTKRGKTYMRIRTRDGDYNTCWLKIWGNPKEAIPLNSIWLCEAEGDSAWGPSTTAWKIRPLAVD